MLLKKRLPRREEHRSADVQPNPFPIIPPARIDDGAVPGVLRRRPAGFRRVGGGGGHGLPRLVVFVIVVVIVVAVVSVATVVRRHRSDVRGAPMVVRCSCHRETEDRISRLDGNEDGRLRPPFVCLSEPTRSAH